MKVSPKDKITNQIFPKGEYSSVTDGISNEEVRAFMNAMNKRYGLDFTNYEIKSLKRGVGRLLTKHGLRSMLDLWTKILKDDGFFKRGIDDLLVNLTEMFRNPDAWEYIRDNILDRYHSYNELKIWHAGCSTGEEVYTMAIVLKEKGLLEKSRILATDLSTKALTKARGGKYELNLIRNYMKPFIKLYPGKSMNDFFFYESDFGVVRPEYNKNISYLQHNLVNEGISRTFDVVFCRNVMIYFDEKLKNHVLTLIHSSLKENGILVIGYYDIMTEFGKSLFEVVDLRTKVYIKK